MNPIGTGRRRSRIRDWGPDLFGRAQNRWRVIRTSNAYTFVDPHPQMSVRPTFPSKSDLPTGTEGQELSLLARPALNPKNPLALALARLEERVRREKGAPPTAAPRS